MSHPRWRTASRGLAWPSDVVEERTALVPVPLAAARERERGYNQSALIASGLASRWRIPVWSDVLERTRVTRTQTELTPGERLSNVAGAFRVRDSRARRFAERTSFWWTTS